MVVDAAQDNRVAALRRQAAIAGLGLHHRHIVEVGGSDRRTNLLEALGIDLRREHLPARPHFGRERYRDLALAGADISHRHTRLERKHLPESRHLGSAGAEAKATPVVAASAEDHGHKDDGRRAPSVPHHREDHSQRRTESLYFRYSAPNRPVRYRSSRGTTTTAMMATVGINVATSHRLLTQIATPRCNAKNAR